VTRTVLPALVAALLFIGLVLFLLGPVLGLLSPFKSASPLTTPTSTSRPTPSPVPAPTLVPKELLGRIAFSVSVFSGKQGLYVKTLRFKYHFPSSIAWLAFLSKPVRRAWILTEVARLRPSARVIWRREDHISTDAVRVMPFVITADEWRHYGFTQPGIYGVRYSTGAIELARGTFRLN
jgi:hypothetical protein